MTTVPVQVLNWDSAFFGTRIARITAERLTPAVVTTVMAFSARERVDCLYLLVDPAETATIRLAEEAGFHLVDIRVTLERRLAAEPASWRSSSPLIRVAMPADIPALRAMAAVNHRDSRFYHDGGFPEERCDELYATWIEKSCRDYADTVLVAAPAGEAVGYLSCHLGEGATGQIGLVGVSSNCQGKGLGRLLLDESLRWFAAAGAERVEVVTQGRNAGAQRLYQKSGFLTSRLQLWYHKRFPTGAERMVD